MKATDTAVASARITSMVETMFAVMDAAGNSEPLCNGDGIGSESLAQSLGVPRLFLELVIAEWGARDGVESAASFERFLDWIEQMDRELVFGAVAAVVQDHAARREEE